VVVGGRAHALAFGRPRHPPRGHHQQRCVSLGGSVQDPTDPIAGYCSTSSPQDQTPDTARDYSGMAEGGGDRLRNSCASAAGRAGRRSQSGSGWRVASRCLMAVGPLIELIGQVSGGLGRQARPALGGDDMKPVVHTDQCELATGLILHRDPVCPVAMYIGAHDFPPRCASWLLSVNAPAHPVMHVGTDRRQIVIGSGSAFGGLLGVPRCLPAASA